MVLCVLSIGLFASLGILTVVCLVSANQFDGLPDGEVRQEVALVAYLILLAYWVLIIPPLKTSNLQMSLVVTMVVVAVPIYAFQAIEDTMVTGVVYGWECSKAAGGCAPTLTAFCKSVYDTHLQPVENQLAYDGLVTTMLIALCNEKNRDTYIAGLSTQESTGTRNVTCVALNDPQNPVSIPTLTRSLYPNMDESAYQAAAIWDNESFCVGTDPNNDNVLWGMVKPGAWLTDFLWFYMEWRMGPFLSFVWACLIAAGAIFLMSFIPPARFATDRLRMLIRDQMLRLRNLGLSAALPAGLGAHENLLNGVHITSTLPQEPLPLDCSIGPASG